MRKNPGICIFTETYHPVVGGGEVQAQNLALELAGEGFSVIVLTRRSDPWLRKMENSGQVTIYRVPPSGTEHFKKWGLLFTGLAALIRHRGKYDLILVSGFRVIGISAIFVGKVFGKPCILKADSLGEMSGEFFLDGLKKLGLDRFWFLFKIFLSFRNNILRMANAFIAISSDIESELLAHGIPKEIIHRIPNSVNTDKFRPVNREDKQLLRQKLSISQEEKVVIYTGRLVSYKGLPLLLEVWRELSRKHNHIRLLLVGAGGVDIHNCETELRGYVRRNGIHCSVSFVGEVQNVYEYLQASDIFVFPTENEAFGIALIEAMACGLPVITTYVGGLKDILRHDQDGIVVPPGDFQHLFDALDQLIMDPALAACLGQAARQIARDMYSINLITQKYVELFRLNLNELAT